MLFLSCFFNVLLIMLFDNTFSVQTSAKLETRLAVCTRFCLPACWACGIGKWTRSGFGIRFIFALFRMVLTAWAVFFACARALCWASIRALVKATIGAFFQMRFVTHACMRAGWIAVVVATVAAVAIGWCTVF